MTKTPRALALIDGLLRTAVAALAQTGSAKPKASQGQALKSFSYKSWNSFMVPRNMPEDVVVRLHAATRNALQDPTVLAQLAAQMQLATAHPPSPTTPPGLTPRPASRAGARHR